MDMQLHKKKKQKGGVRTAIIKELVDRKKKERIIKQDLEEGVDN